MKSLLILIFIIIALPACATANLSTIETLEKQGNFETLIQLLKETQLEDEIKKLNKITLFAPTDSAFKKIPTDVLNDILNDKEFLTNILLYHIAPKRLTLKRINKQNEIKTLAGKTILVNKKELTLNESKIIGEEVRTTNGKLITIDTVLVPDDSKPDNTFETESFVDIERYMGRWYEYARYENSFQEECLGSIAEYELAKTPILKRTYVKVRNSCQTKDGGKRVGNAKAFVANQETNASLKVSFVPLLNYFAVFAGDYNILKLGPNYEYALVGDKARSTFWILTREPEISEDLYQELLDIAEEKGFRRELISKSPKFNL